MRRRLELNQPQFIEIEGHSNHEFWKKKPKIVLSCLSDVQSMFVMNNNINGDISSHVSGCN